MEDDNKKHPSLPANYVTLVQLQERWLKEKERKEKEKEREEELKRKNDSVDHRSRPNSSKSTSSNRRVWNRRDKPVALVSGVEVSGDGDKNADEGGKSVTSKKETNRRRKNPSLQVEKEVTEKDGVAHALPENVDKEDIGSRRNEESRGRGVGGGLRAKGNNLDQRVEVETKIRELSVNARTGKGNGEFRRTSTFHNPGYREFRGNGYKRFGRRELWKQTDSGMVWIKKGELFNGNAGTMEKSESSGSVSEKPCCVELVPHCAFHDLRVAGNVGASDMEDQEPWDC
ncbi:hypothetical protein FNV43_RR11721 [Rhamnella rubrinervis]|uniref:Uncharacterized protein n=1 Tax=Rhamnella rubrinervis TaxID=2594499 RepID=A0A8K0MHW1_9ROSA|nr:hypothetical protein FNV43_RR11721 [Rhamnella rubrinervis]